MNEIGKSDGLLSRLGEKESVKTEKVGEVRKTKTAEDVKSKMTEGEKEVYDKEDKKLEGSNLSEKEKVSTILVIMLIAGVITTGALTLILTDDKI